jgi:serine/threonine-protein kinase RsbW
MESGLTWLSLPADIASLQRFIQFVREGALAAGVPETGLGRLDLVVEEIVVNVARYAYPPDRPGAVEVGWAVAAPGRLLVSVCDCGVAYNPLHGPPPQFEADLAAREVGGLGVFLVKNLTQSVTYCRKGGSNVLSFVFLG